MIIAVFDISVAFFHGKVRKVIYVVPPKDLRKKGKIWRLLKSLYGTRDASQVFATYVEEGLNDHGFQRNAVVLCLYWGAIVEALGVHWGDDFIFGIPNDKANDLEQLMREVFKVKICERIGPGFLTSVEFLHKKVGWNLLDARSETHIGSGGRVWFQRQETTRANEVESHCGTCIENGRYRFARGCRRPG